MTSVESQNRRILQYMREHGSITAMEAINQIGCMRLAARVADLKDEGHRIRTEICHSKRWGAKPVRYARYYLYEEDE